MFIATLFTIYKTWKQPKYSLTDEWVKKMWYMYIMEYYSAVKRMRMSFAATLMELEILILSEERETQITYHSYVESKIWYK